MARRRSPSGKLSSGKPSSARKKRERGSASKASASEPPHREPPSPETAAPPKTDWRERGRAYGLLLLSAVLMFLGFAGFGVWPLAFVGMVPALFVFEQLRLEAKPSRTKFFWRALFFGYVAYYGGFYWVVNTIVDFGGFPYPIALLFASIYFLYQAFEYVAILWLYQRARGWGLSPTLALVSSYLAVETLFPQLFDHFYGNSFYMLPHLVQVADLGGPMLLTALAMAGNGALFEVAKAWVDKRPLPKAAPAAFAIASMFALGYSTYRIGEVEARMSEAPSLHVGVVQTNMGIYEKREDPGEGLRRHVEQSLLLERQGVEAGEPLDLLVWPESAATFVLPRDRGVPIRPFLERALDFYGVTTEGIPTTPLLFGGLSREPGEEHDLLYNTAFITDTEGELSAHYDKTYLLAFGEYLPFGELLPQLYEYSPHTGHFTPGDDVRPLPLGEYRISTLVCYEDILPGFVRRFVTEGSPHLLVNITNDAWFGRTQEPYVHLALAEMRAVEHHLFLIRATNTGVSAIVDPLGRVVEESPLFDRSSLRGQVRMLQGRTLYSYLGDWPGYLAVLGLVAAALFAWRRRRVSAP
ncbi:MAG: apolipoprotein N-acyltransferase [Sandaracinaceae bacterium]